MLGLQQQLAARGWASVAINWRGCSGEPNLLPRAYHSGASDDLAEVIGHLQAKRPLAPLYAVGYSLGGNVLLKYLGESGIGSPLRKAVAVSVPFRLDQCADRIGLGFSRVYQAHFMKAMVAYVKDKQQRFQHEGLSEHLGALQRLGPLQGMRTFWDFDGRFTAPLHGYSDAHDYYRRASSRYYLPTITTPTLLIQAEDDPFVFRHSVPEPAELSASTSLELHRRGGHVGFVEGTPRRPRYYLSGAFRNGWASPGPVRRPSSAAAHPARRSTDVARQPPPRGRRSRRSRFPAPAPDRCRVASVPDRADPRRHRPWQGSGSRR